VEQLGGSNSNMIDILNENGMILYVDGSSLNVAQQQRVAQSGWHSVSPA
jgi:hypothetical protein